MSLFFNYIYFVVEAFVLSFTSPFFFEYFLIFLDKLMVTLLKNGRLSRSIPNVPSEELVLSHNFKGGQNKK